VARLVKPDLAEARNLEARQKPPALVFDGLDELDALVLELAARRLDVLAHQEELGPTLLASGDDARAWMTSQLGRRQHEVQPSVAAVERFQTEYVAEKRSGGFRVVGLEKSVDARDHGAAN
jgi:hypothetical protein